MPSSSEIFYTLLRNNFNIQPAYLIDERTRARCNKDAISYAAGIIKIDLLMINRYISLKRTFEDKAISYPTMKLPVYIVDAFTDKLFGGNPAAVCPLDKWLSDDIMQGLGAENNLSETVFFVRDGDQYKIRWFTPATEVKLCGHATLASAHILFTELGYTKREISFNSLSGVLRVSNREDGKITLDFPVNTPEPVNEVPQKLLEGLGVTDAMVFKSSFDYMVVLPSQKDVEALTPDFRILGKVEARGVITTARGDEADFVSRCFYPQSGIDEDPVTGSAHTVMVPYWATILNKSALQAIQVSKRRGYLDCVLAGERVLMSGNAVTYLKGEYVV